MLPARSGNVKSSFAATYHYLDKRLSLEESVGHLPMECALEAVHQVHSVDPGFLMEDPGMDHLPGTALPHPNWPQGLHVTTVTVSRSNKVSDNNYYNHECFKEGPL